MSAAAGGPAGSAPPRFQACGWWMVGSRRRAITAAGCPNPPMCTSDPPCLRGVGRE